MSDDQVFDLFIIGGGINGTGIARDAAGRGLRVGLAEAGELGGATSSASTKLFHGGLRYLEFFEFGLVKSALKEREVLLKAIVDKGPAVDAIVGAQQYTIDGLPSEAHDDVLRAVLDWLDAVAD